MSNKRFEPQELQVARQELGERLETIRRVIANDKNVHRKKQSFLARLLQWFA